MKGGSTNCTFYRWSDRYGKFYQSWIDANLGQWLSPVHGLQSIRTLDLTNITITGPNEISTCATTVQYYTIAGLLGVSYTWTVSAGLQIISGQGTPYITIEALPGVQNRTEVITLTLESPTKGRNPTYIVSRNITVVAGTPNTPTISSYGSENICYELNHDYRFEVTNPESSVQYYTWGYEKPDGTTVILTDYGSTLSPPYVFYNEGSCTVFATPRNGCGAGNRGELGIYVNPWWQTCDGYQYYSLAVSPNPTQGDLNVSIADEKPEIKALGKNETVQILLYEFYTKQIVKQWQFKNDQNKFKVNVAGLRKGQYIIQVKIGKYSQAKQILVN